MITAQTDHILGSRAQLVCTQSFFTSTVWYYLEYLIYERRCFEHVNVNFKIRYLLYIFSLIADRKDVQ